MPPWRKILLAACALVVAVANADVVVVLNFGANVVRESNLVA